MVSILVSHILEFWLFEIVVIIISFKNKSKTAIFEQLQSAVYSNFRIMMDYSKQKAKGKILKRALLSLPNAL